MLCIISMILQSLEFSFLNDKSENSILFCFFLPLDNYECCIRVYLIEYVQLLYDGKFNKKSIFKDWGIYITNMGTSILADQTFSMMHAWWSAYRYDNSLLAW